MYQNCEDGLNVWFLTDIFDRQTDTLAKLFLTIPPLFEDMLTLDNVKQKTKQAGAELGQAQLKLGLYFT